MEGLFHILARDFLLPYPQGPQAHSVRSPSFFLNTLLREAGSLRRLEKETSFKGKGAESHAIAKGESLTDHLDVGAR